MRRGFKSEANAIARELRAELGLAATAPLDAFALAQFLEIPLVPLSSLHQDAPEAVKMLSGSEAAAFSAATIFSDCHRMIVYNDAHAPGRQSSDLAHELAHALLHHPPKPAFGPDGERNWNSELEAEADWLAGALLISDEAAIGIVQRGLSLGDAAREYSTSALMVKFRLNVTGARIRVARMSRWRM